MKKKTEKILGFVSSLLLGLIIGGGTLAIAIIEKQSAYYMILPIAIVVLFFIISYMIITGKFEEGS